MSRYMNVTYFKYYILMSIILLFTIMPLAYGEQSYLKADRKVILGASNIGDKDVFKLAYHSLRFQKNKFRISKRFIKASSPNYTGGWHGRFIQKRDDCGVLSSSFLFRHIIQYGRSNAVRIATSHDGTLYGISRNKGKRLEVSRSYNSNNVLVTVALVYDNLRNGVASVGLGIVLSTSQGRCLGGFGATSIRAF